MTESESINKFKRFCRQEFQNLANQLNLKEVIQPKRKYENPYKISFKNKDYFFQFESISYGFRLGTTFGKSSRIYSFSVNNAICLIKGRAEADRYNDTCPSGYQANLKRDLTILCENLSFFTQLDDHQKILNLLEIQKENSRLYSK